MKTRMVKRIPALLLTLVLLAVSLPTRAESSGSTKLNTYYSLALGYLRKEDYGQAMEYLEAALSLCTEETDADMYADLHLKKGCIFTIRKEYEEAVKELDETIRVRPDLPEAYLVKVQVYSETNNLAETIVNLEKYIELTGDISMNETLANLYLQAEEREKAEESFRKLVEGNSTDPADVPYNLAVYEMGAGMYEEALANLRANTADPARTPGLHYNSGICLMMLGNNAEAVTEFTASLETENYFSNAIYNRAVCNMNLQEFRTAIEDFTSYINALTQRVMQAAAETAEAVEVLEGEVAAADAEGTAETGETAEAEEAAVEVVEVTETEAEGAAETGEIAEAEESAVEVVEVTETEAEGAAAVEEMAGAEPEGESEAAKLPVDEAWYFRGVCYISVEEYENAAADFTTCLEYGVNTMESQFNRGLSLLQSGKYEDAKADFTASIENGFMADDALYYRSFAERYLGENEAALADLTLCVEHEYNLGYTYTQRAQVYQALGDEENYLADLEASLEYLEE